MLASAAAFAEVRFVEWESFFPAAGTAALWLLGGGLLLGAALWLSPYRLPFMQPARETAFARTARWPLVAGIVLLALGTIIGGRLIEALPTISVHLQFALLLAAALLIGWALSGAPRALPHVPRRDLWIVAALTAAALIMRIWEVTGSAPGLIDELHFIHGMRAIQDDPAAPLLRQVSTFLPATIVYSYWQLLGVELVGRTLEGLRLASALAGTLTVPAVYLLARALFDRRTAVAAGLLLLAFPPHVFFSRIGFAHITDAFFGALALALFAQALRGGQRWAWAWGGVALGMTQYFYEGGRLLFPPLALIWFIYLALVWGPRRIRPHLRGMAVALIAAVLIALPMYVTMAATSAPFSSRFNDAGGASNLFDDLRRYETMGVFEQHNLANRFVSPFLGYIALTDTSGDFYGHDQPMVLPILVPLLLLGAWHSLYRPRSPAIIVLGGVLAASAGNIFAQETLWYPRYIAVMPLLPVLMAVGLRYTLPLLWPRPRLPRSPRLRAIGAALIPAVAVAAAVLQIAYFFGPFREQYAVSFRAWRPYPDHNDAVLRAAALPDPAHIQVVLVSTIEQDVHVPRGLYSFLVADSYPLTTVTAADFTAGFLADLPRDRGYAFFLEPADAESVRRLAAAFPLGPPAYSTRPLLPASAEYLMFVIPPPGG